MVSMKDIANRLQISRCTVSNILNERFENKSYRKETIELVRATAKEMGYVSNNVARSLKTGSTGTIAIDKTASLNDDKSLNVLSNS